MDWRLYVLAGAALLFAASFLYLVAALAGAARARTRAAHERGSARMALPAAVVTLEPRPAEEDALLREEPVSAPSGGTEQGVFPELWGPAGESSLTEPLRTGDWQPKDTSAESVVAGDLDLGSGGVADDLEPDLRELAASLEDSPRRPAEAPTPAPAPDSASASRASPSETLEELLAQLEALGLSVTPRAAGGDAVRPAEREAAAVPAPAPSTQPIYVYPVLPQYLPAPYSPSPYAYPGHYPAFGHPQPAFPFPHGVQPAVIPGPAPHAAPPETPAAVPPVPPVPVPEVATPMPPVGPEVASGAWLQMAVVPEPVTEPVPEPVPEPVLVPTQPAEVRPQVRQAPLAEPVPIPAPASAPVEEERLAVPPVAPPRPAPADRPEVVIAPRREDLPTPVAPEPRGRPHVTLRVASRPVAAETAHALLESEPPAARIQPPASDAELALVSPVEMWFGDFRIGVKPGTKTFAEFQRLAGILFDDLRAARAV